MRLNWRASVRSQSGVSPGCLLGLRPQRELLVLRIGQMIGAEPQLARAAVDERIGEAADVARRLPDARVEDDRRVERDDVVALAHHRLEPARLDVLLEQHAVVPVVVGRAETAVDLRRREHEAAPAGERDDLVHRDHVGHSSGRYWYTRARYSLSPCPSSPTARPSSCTSSPTRPVRRRRGSCSRSRRSSRISPFDEVRHPRVETVDDLELAVAQRARPPGGDGVHARRARAPRRDAPSLPTGARALLPTSSGHPIESISRVAGVAARMEPGARAPLDADVLQAHRGDRVRRQVRRRRRRRARRGRHRARRRLPHVEDTALDLPRLPRPQDGERPDRQRRRAARGAVRDRPGQDRRAHDRRASASPRFARSACAPWAGRVVATRGSRRCTRSSRRPPTCTDGSAAR